MKVTVIIATMMVAQVSASFLDVFQGAVLSVQNSFGKLFSDVVTDVKDTVDCTILALEHILSLSEDATARYYKKCASAKNDTQSDSPLKNNLPVLEISIANNEEYLKKDLPEEIDAKINATLLKFLNGYNPHDKLEEVQKELAKETERLADVSNLVRQELDKLSKEIHLDFTNAERKGYKPSVDSILDELKVLEVIEQNIRNSSESNEIHRLVGDVLNKLHEIESSGAKQNVKVDGILRDLERSSNRSYKDMRQQLKDWKVEEAKHLNVIKSKMDEHENVPKHLEYAKMDNTFTNEIASRTIPLNSKNIVESILPNIITKQISSTPKIAIQPSLDATSPVQINDATGVVTPVSISTNSYVNKIIVDVTETLIPQRFKEKPIVDHMRDKTSDFTTPITIKLLERSIKHRISRPGIIPEVTSFVPNNTSELSASPLVPTTESNTSTNKIPGRDTSVQKAIPQISTYLSIPISENRGSSNTYFFKTSIEPIRNLTTIQPENVTTSLPMTPVTNTIIEKQLPEEQTSVPKLIIELNTSSATMEPERIKSLSLPPKDTTYVSVLSPQSTISEMTPEPATTVLVTVNDPTESSTMTTESTTSISLTTPKSIAIFTTTPEPSKQLLIVSTERDTNPSTHPELTRHIPVMDTDPETKLAINPETTMDLLVTTAESTTNPETTPEFSTNLQETAVGKIINANMVPKSTTTIPVSTMETTTSPAITENSHTSLQETNPELAASPTTDPVSTIDILVPAHATSTNPATTTGLTADLPEISDSTINSILSLVSATSLLVTANDANKGSSTSPEPSKQLLMVSPERDSNPSTHPELTKHIPVMDTKPATKLAINLETTMDLVTTAESITNPETTPEFSTNLQGTTVGKIINAEMVPKSTTTIPVSTMETTTSPAITENSHTSLEETNPEPATSPTTDPVSTIDILVPANATSTNPATTTGLTTDLPEISNSTINSILSLIPATSLLVTAIDANKGSSTNPEPSKQQMVSTERDSNPSTHPELTKHIPVMDTEPATKLAINPETTMDLLVTTAESTTNPETTSEFSTNLQETAVGKIINAKMVSKSTKTIPVSTMETTTSPAITENSHTSLKETNPEPATSPTTDPVSTIDILVPANATSTNPATNTGLTTDLPEISNSTINSILSLVPATSLLVTAIDANKGSSTNPRQTTSIPIMASEITIFETTTKNSTSIAKTIVESTKHAAALLEPTTSLPVTARELSTMLSEFTTDLFPKPPESTTNLKAIPEPRKYPSMTTIERDTNPTTTPEPTRHISVTAVQPATSSEVSPESTMYKLTTTNPETAPGISMDLQVTAPEKVINSSLISTSIINIPMMTTNSTTNPTMIKDSNTSLAVASKLISVATKPKPPTNLTKISTAPTTYFTVNTPFLMKTPETKLDFISELTTDPLRMTSESMSPIKTSEPIPNMLRINSDVTTRTTNTLETITIFQPKHSIRTQELITNYLVTVPEPTINSTGTQHNTTKPPRTTKEFTTHQLVKTTDPPKITPEVTTSLTATIRKQKNRLAPNHSVLVRNISGSDSKSNISSLITPEPITNRPVSSNQKPISTSHAKPRDRSMSSTVTILKPTSFSTMLTLGHTLISKMEVPEPVTKLSKTIRETTTSRLIITSESSTTPTETMTKSTTGSSRTTLKLVTNNLSKLQHLFNLPTHRPGVSTPSLNAFLNYIDRKEGFTRPNIQSTRMTTTIATPVGADVKILPLTPRSYSKSRSAIKSGPINTKLNAFFSHLPTQNKSPYARNNYAVPVDRTVPGVLGLTSPKIKIHMPLTTSLNKNAQPIPLSLSHLTPMMPYNESPYGGNNNVTPLSKGMPQKRHILPQRRNDQNAPIQPSARLPTNLSRSLGLTTNKPVPTPKINHYDDSDYKSFFQNSFDSEAHSRALKEAKKLIEDSKRAHRIINNIFNKKNKGISAFNFLNH